MHVTTYGYDEAGSRLAKCILEAAAYFLGRLPETFADQAVIADVRRRLHRSYAWIEVWLQGYRLPSHVTLIECAAAVQVEAGVMPRAADGVASNDAVRERAVIVRAMRADREHGRADPDPQRSQ